jgi:hypothetical protein
VLSVCGGNGIHSQYITSALTARLCAACRLISSQDSYTKLYGATYLEVSKPAAASSAGSAKAK